MVHIDRRSKTTSFSARWGMGLSAGLLVLGLIVTGCAARSDTTTLVQWSHTQFGDLSATVQGDANLQAGHWATLEIDYAGFVQLPSLDHGDLDKLFRVEADTATPAQAGSLRLRLLPLDPGSAHVTGLRLLADGEILEIPSFDRVVASNFKPGDQPKLESTVPDVPPIRLPWWLWAGAGVLLAVGGGLLLWWRLRQRPQALPMDFDFTTAFQALLAAHATTANDSLGNEASTLAIESFLAAEGLLNRRFGRGWPQNQVLSDFRMALEQEKFQPSKLSYDRQRELLLSLAPWLEEKL